MLIERKLSSRVSVFFFSFFWERIYDSIYQSAKALHLDVGQSINESINTCSSSLDPVPSTVPASGSKTFDK